MILLTGGSGFVGKALLAAPGDDAVVTVGRTPAAHTHVALDLAAASDEGVAHAVTELKPFHPTTLVHCAAVTPWSSGAPDFSLDLKIAQRVVELCQKLAIERFIFVSGWNVYDTAALAPYDEAKTPLNPTTDYGRSKLAVEEYLTASLANTKLISLRAASLYGPGQTTPGLIPNLVGSALRGEPISLQAKTTRRDYVYIDDFVAAVTAAIELTTAEPHTIVNIGSGTTQSIEEVATAVQQICQKLYGNLVTISFAEELSEGQPSNNQLAIAKAQSLGLLPNATPFPEGLESATYGGGKMKLFFDFDGTIVDVAPRHYRVYTETVEFFGGTPLPQEEYWGLKREKTKWTALLEMSKLDANIELQFLDRFIDKIENPDYLRSDQLFPGAKELLADLASRHELYLVSLRRHPERLNEQLQGLGVEQYFTAILSGHSESDGSDVKTSLIEAKLGGENGLIVGDTEADILTGKALGLTTVAVTTGIRDEQFLRALEPDYVIESIQELVVITKN